MQICLYPIRSAKRENVKNHSRRLSQDAWKNKNVISNWERGDNKPDADMILNLCRILDVDPNQILDWSEDQDYAELSTLEQKHIENYRSLESWQRKSIDELILRFLDHTEEETLTDTPVIQVPFIKSLQQPEAGTIWMRMSIKKRSSLKTRQPIARSTIS